MKALNLLFIFFIVLLPVSCRLRMEPDGYSLNFFNKTENDVLYFLCRWDTEYTRQFVRENKLNADSTLYHKDWANPNHFHPFFMVEDDPEVFLKSTDTISLFILDKEEYEGKTWSQLVDSAHFRQIYHLSGDDIRLIGTKIPYPPTEIMRNMVMVPSYEEAVR